MPATPVTAWKNIGVMRGIGIAMVVLNHASMGAFGVLRASPLCRRWRCWWSCWSRA